MKNKEKSVFSTRTAFWLIFFLLTAMVASVIAALEWGDGESIAKELPYLLSTYGVLFCNISAIAILAVSAVRFFGEQRERELYALSPDFEAIKALAAQNDAEMLSRYATIRHEIKSLLALIDNLAETGDFASAKAAAASLSELIAEFSLPVYSSDAHLNMALNSAAVAAAAKGVSFEAEVVPCEGVPTDVLGMLISLVTDELYAKAQKGARISISTEKTETQPDRFALIFRSAEASLLGARSEAIVHAVGAGLLRKEGESSILFDLGGK